MPSKLPEMGEDAAGDGSDAHRAAEPNDFRKGKFFHHHGATSWDTLPPIPVLSRDLRRMAGCGEAGARERAHSPIKSPQRRLSEVDQQRPQREREPVPRQTRRFVRQ